MFGNGQHHLKKDVFLKNLEEIRSNYRTLCYTGLDSHFNDDNWLCDCVSRCTRALWLGQVRCLQ